MNQLLPLVQVARVHREPAHFTQSLHQQHTRLVVWGGADIRTSEREKLTSQIDQPKSTMDMTGVPAPRGLDKRGVRVMNAPERGVATTTQARGAV